jgi:hypothetical protein
MKKRFVPWLLVGAFVVSACAGAIVEADTLSVTTTTPPAPTNEQPSEPPLGSFRPVKELLPVQDIPSHLSSVSGAWSTDFAKATVDLNELLVGIPASDPRDMIPPIDDPLFIHVSEADWLTDQDPGLAVEIDGIARFYPLAVLTRHEIVNDEFGDVPVAVTYCPLCNTGLVFDRRFDGEVLRLGVSGLLRNSDLVMWDNVSQTLWQQITGEGVVGRYAGHTLTPIGSAIVRFADFESTYPDGEAMADNQGFGRAYGRNPYAFYSSREQPYAFFQGEIDDRFPALERVVGVTIDDTSKAYPFSEIDEIRAVNDVVAGEPVVVFWGAPDTADALDSDQISESRGIGTAVAYSSVVDGQTLTFSPLNDTEFFDFETGTTWSLLGKAIDGELAGSELELLPHRNEFWFAWQAFFPDSDVWEA